MSSGLSFSLSLSLPTYAVGLITLALASPLASQGYHKEQMTNDEMTYKLRPGSPRSG